jgi:hypothetical protein
MSATRSPSPVPGSAGHAARDRQGSPDGANRRVLTVTFVLALAWSAALLVMDLATARPRVISRDQILNADVVVSARRVTGEGDRIKVERVFFRGEVAEGDQLRVLNLAKVKGMTDDQDYIVPLSHSRQDFVVTKLEGQHVPPLIYKSNPAAVEEIKSILRDHL